MKKIKILSILLAFCLVFSSTPVYATDTTSIIGTEYYELKMSLQENALVAYELFWNSLEKTDDGEALYPDTYAGCYIESNKLHMSLTDVTEETLEYYYNIFGKYVNYVTFSEALFSYNYLRDIAESTLTTALNNKDIIEFYVSNKENKIIVGAEKNNINNIKKESYYTNSTLYKIVEITEKETEDVGLDVSNKISTSAMLYLSGGRKITFPSTWLTMAICGYYDSYPAILTCGHGNYAVTETVKYLDSDEVIGPVALKRYSQNMNGDFGIIFVTGSTVEMTNTIVDSIQITGVYANPPVGTTVKKYGVSSGYAYGSITELGVYDSTCKGRTRAALSYGTATGGDSGGPYYVTQNGENLFCGVHHGSYLENNIRYVSFTPYTYINAVGFTAKRN